ncbi:serine protease, S9A family peptidase [Halovivax ruber XH-70]|uniref:prolyl oligopeptidase n=1 Tax=Halovivax ruber (strain DSM 18193 / JCM 13892 / XH-70) TaxID=797302 RepID=L0IEF3_HALRX|nr:prolyl oligopeptidase family serine peptidase [Halovivax ruber]AGB17218.1 serine protease, S9A family peptidase [Halovivax ruber XH-70]
MSNPTGSDPPATERDPVIEELHGEEIADPYRWLEGDGEAVDEWEDAQNAYTDQFVETERREGLRPQFERVAEHATYQLPVARGGRYFQLIEAADADQPRLTVRTERDAEPRTLVDPTEFGETVSLGWFVPDPDGERVVYGLMDGGTEEFDLRVLDVERGEVIDRVDDVGRCGEFSVAWQGNGFYYQQTGSAADDELLEKAIRYHEIGDDGADRLVTEAIPERRWPQVQVDRETGLVLVSLGELASDTELYVLEDGELVPLVTDVDASLELLAHEGRVFLLTNHDAPRFRLLGIDAATLADGDAAELSSDAAALDAFEPVVPESDDVLFDVAPAGDGLAVHRIRDARSVVSLHDADGTERHELALPEYTGVGRGALGGSSDTDEAFLALQTFDRPSSIVHADAGSGAGPDDWTVVQEPDLPTELDPRAELDLTVERLWVDSTDGATVPVYVVHRADLEPDGDAPTILYGYGGFRIPLLPGFDAYRLPFLAAGGVFAVACLRGGLEFGEEWHEAGHRAQKTHTFDDFEAAGEALIEEGYTNSDRLAAWGGSNGGLLVGAAITRRPELFGAAICAVPLLDMLRFHEFLLGATWTPEYGSPDDPEEFAWLREYSPYHNVSETAYPATLFQTAAGDTRVHPSHARKMTARVQHATTGDAPICFRGDEGTGHGAGTATSIQIEQQLDRWTFVFELLGVGGEE